MTMSQRHGRSRARKRAKVIAMLGSRCVGCGTRDVRVLQIDHRLGDGYKLRRGGRIRGFDEKHYADIINGDDPLDRYQLLCANCHSLKNKGYTIGSERNSAADKAKQAVREGLRTLAAKARWV